MAEFSLLAASIITQAFTDMKKYRPKKDESKSRVKYADWNSADKFFKSEWFRVLAEVTKADSAVIIDQVNILRAEKGPKIEKIRMGIAKELEEKKNVQSFAQ